MAIYYALVHKEPKSDYGVSFPDFPGCATAGSTMDEAYSMAVEALAAHVAFMRADGDAVPAPSPLDVVRRHEDAQDAETILGIPLEAEEPPVRINISLPANELKAIDSAAERQGMTRSGFLVHAARTAMRGEMTVGSRTRSSGTALFSKPERGKKKKA
jgi:predicted RNase H-like HicB family nuclease